MRIISFLSVLLPTLLFNQPVLAGLDTADNPVGQILYITEPACGFYQCSVLWHHGDTVNVNWIGIPQGQGNVSVSLASNIGGPTYVISPSYPVVSQPGYCDAGQGFGVVIPGIPCGALRFVVPAGWENAQNYTIVVQSLIDESQVGYTDKITIAASNTTNPGTSGTAVSLVAIPAPTSTDKADATTWSGTFPEPTAIIITGNATVKSTSTGVVSSATGSQKKKNNDSPTLSSSSGSSSFKSPSSTTSSTTTTGAGIRIVPSFLLQGLLSYAVGATVL